LAERVMGEKFSPRLRQEGRLVEVRRSGSQPLIVAYAHQRQLIVRDTRDKRLEAFIRYWLGRRH